MQKSVKKLRHQVGFGLISMVVALGLLGLLALNMNRLLQFGFQSSSNIGMSMDKQAIKATLLQGADCALSLAPVGRCTPGEVLGLKKALPSGGERLLVKANNPPTQMGRFTLKAECNQDGDGIILRAARMRSPDLFATESQAFLPDPLTKRVVTWSDREALLFPSGSSVCQAGGTPIRFLGTCEVTSESDERGGALPNVVNTCQCPAGTRYMMLQHNYRYSIFGSTEGCTGIGSCSVVEQNTANVRGQALANACVGGLIRSYCAFFCAG